MEGSGARPLGTAGNRVGSTEDVVCRCGLAWVGGPISMGCLPVEVFPQDGDICNYMYIYTHVIIIYIYMYIYIYICMYVM